MYLFWNDERLNVTDKCEGFIDHPILQKIWRPRPDIPHTSFIEKTERIGGTTDYYSADPNSLFWYLELNIGIQCPFDYSFYPFDTNECDVLFISHFYSDQDVNYTSLGLVDESKEIQHSLKYDVEYKEISDEAFPPKIPATGFTVKLSRRLGAAFINKFIPSSLIVVLAFCRFEIPILDQ